jgi:hypothetical protein
MIDLDEYDLRQMCTEASFDRGERYFEEARVCIKEATPTRVIHGLVRQEQAN